MNVYLAILSACMIGALIASAHMMALSWLALSCGRYLGWRSLDGRSHDWRSHAWRTHGGRSYGVRSHSGRSPGGRAHGIQPNYKWCFTVSSKSVSANAISIKKLCTWFGVSAHDILCRVNANAKQAHKSYEVQNYKRHRHDKCQINTKLWNAAN